MSIYFNSAKELYIVRKYHLGAYSYLGQYPTEELAKAAEAKWKAEREEEKANQPFEHTLEWFNSTSKQQLKDLASKYPAYVNGKPRKVGR